MELGLEITICQASLLLNMWQYQITRTPQHSHSVLASLRRNHTSTNAKRILLVVILQMCQSIILALLRQLTEYLNIPWENYLDSNYHHRSQIFNSKYQYNISHCLQHLKVKEHLQALVRSLATRPVRMIKRHQVPSIAQTTSTHFGRRKTLHQPRWNLLLA